MVTKNDKPSILSIKPKTGKLEDLPLELRCKIYKEHKFYCMCKDIAVLMFLLFVLCIVGGFELS